MSPARFRCATQLFEMFFCWTPKFIYPRPLSARHLPVTWLDYIVSHHILALYSPYRDLQSQNTIDYSGKIMSSISGPSHLINPLATPAHLEISASQLDGVSKDLEDSVRYETTRLLEASGILLRLPQEIIAQSIVLLSRFWSGADGASMLDCDAKVCLHEKSKQPRG